MPLYEYQCQACEGRVEVIQRFSDAPLATCADCGGDLRKLISSPAIQFKGSGFYITDYARNGGSTGTKTDAASTSDSGKTGESTTSAAGDTTTTRDSSTATSTTTGTKATPSGTASGNSAS